MANYILFGIYIFVVIGLFGFITIFMMHIKDYQKYSSYVAILTRTYIVIMLIIATIGGYYVLSGTIFPNNKAPIKRINL